MGGGLAAEVARQSPPLDQWRSFVYCESVTGNILGSVDHFPVRFLTRGVAVAPVIVKSEGLAGALADGGEAVLEQAGTIFAGLSKLITGSLPLSNLGGPIAIARVAGDDGHLHAFK